MSAIYELLVLGDPSRDQLTEVEQHVRDSVRQFGLVLGTDVSWRVKPVDFLPNQQLATAAVYFGGAAATTVNLDVLLTWNVPVLPVVSTLDRVATEVPEVLRVFNCMSYVTDGAERVAHALLECVGLLPRVRRVFLSYVRSEARQAAVQLFDAFSARLFDVFLDTYDIAPGEDFQAVLWHRLCDSDVLIMLDTPNYFSSRWTSAEYGRALAKGIAVLRIGWPDCTPSSRTATASRAELIAAELDTATGRLSDDAVNRICRHLEEVRSQAHAVRYLNLAASVRNSVERIGGSVSGLGSHKAIYLKLPDGRRVVAYPTVGVPTSTSLHEAVTHGNDASIAVVYDHIGLRRDWLEHLDWLGSHVRAARWVRASDVAWDMADW